MTRTLLTLTLLTTLISPIAAQEDVRPLSVTLRATSGISSSLPSADTSADKRTVPGYPPFCPPKTCLYYAGDFESSYSDADGLFNSDNPNRSLVGQAWVGVKPDRDATVTGVTFVQAFPGGSYSGINPTPFAVQVGIRPGQAGKTVCSTHGSATYKLYGNGGEAVTYSYTIKKLAKSCKLKKGKVYYVNLLPITNTTFGYLWNVPPMPQNHQGWKDDPNDCYFNGAAFGLDYVTCDSQGPFSVLDIGLTGKQ